MARPKIFIFLAPMLCYPIPYSRNHPISCARRTNYRAAHEYDVIIFVCAGARPIKVRART